MRQKIEEARAYAHKQMRNLPKENDGTPEQMGLYHYWRGRAGALREVLVQMGNFEGGVPGGGQAPKTASVIISSKIPQDPFDAGPAHEYTITEGQDAVINTREHTIYITWEDK